MRFASFECDFEREPLSAPFGFKGGYVRELWQASVELSGSGVSARGLGTQSVLWSDAEVFVRRHENAGNAMMFLSAVHAAELGRNIDWSDPVELLDKILEPAHSHAKLLTGSPSLRLTFTLNSLVPLDNAAWLFMAKTKGIASFDEMLPADFKPVLSERHAALAMIPLVTYGVPLDGVQELLKDGCCLLKIKIGSDPDKDGDLDKMLEWDKRRLAEIHAVADRFESPHTESGRILYYLDANGRYDSLSRVESLLAHAKKIGALDRVALFEEPFPEDMKADVSSLPVRVAADESAHSEKDVEERISLGYRAIALKPIAKTLSMSLRMAKAAAKKGVPCFCADLTVNPLLVDWNKNFAARLGRLPGMKIGVLESNGPQNYRNWEAMLDKHPAAGSSWLRSKNGVFELDSGFYARSGGIFDWEKQREAK